jgi:hypothetical protein
MYCLDELTNNESVVIFLTHVTKPAQHLPYLLKLFRETKISR